MKYPNYSVVKIKVLHKKFSENDLSFCKRAPKVGDVATIIEVYETPELAYELECSNKSNGETEWMLVFTPCAADFELID